MIGIDFDFRDIADVSESDDDPVVSGAALAACFPAFAHSLRATGKDEIVLGAEKTVVAGHDDAAVSRGREIEVLGAFEFLQIRKDFAMNAKSRDSAVRKNIQAQMSPAMAYRRSEKDSAFRLEASTSGESRSTSKRMPDPSRTRRLRSSSTPDNFR